LKILNEILHFTISNLTFTITPSLLIFDFEFYLKKLITNHIIILFSINIRGQLMITVLRLGHRPARDKRITTHVALVARAFNADQILIDTKDEKLKSTIQSVVDRFGGEFQVQTGIAWRKMVKKWQGTIIHLTMYGEHFEKVIDKIQKLKKKDILIIVGAEKMPREVYDLADFNIAIGHQPHSEVAALAICMDRLLQGKQFQKEFQGMINIQDCANGKIVIESKSSK
jgi:tRNA (cytidine56-2'-O)-methyltransferase